MLLALLQISWLLWSSCPLVGWLTPQMLIISFDLRVRETGIHPSQRAVCPLLDSLAYILTSLCLLDKPFAAVFRGSICCVDWCRELLRKISPELKRIFVRFRLETGHHQIHCKLPKASRRFLNIVQTLESEDSNTMAGNRSRHAPLAWASGSSLSSS